MSKMRMFFLKNIIKLKEMNIRTWKQESRGTHPEVVRLTYGFNSPKFKEGEMPFLLLLEWSAF
jgi:hypothetical protein